LDITSAVSHENVLAPGNGGSVVPGSEQSELSEIGQTAVPILPTTPPTMVFEKNRAVEHTVANQTKKPKKKVSEDSGQKKNN